MNTKRYLTALIAAFAITFSFASCSPNKPVEKKTSQQIEVAEETTAVTEETTCETTAYEDNKLVELELIYEIIDGKACVTGYKGEGNFAKISDEYNGTPVTVISGGAFEGCTALKTVSFYSDVMEIGESAFKDCTSLTSISTPSSLQVIKNHAFENCSGMESLTIYGSPDIGEYAFAGCTQIQAVGFDKNTKKIANHAFEGCTSLEKTAVLNPDTQIGISAFANCPNLSDAPAETGDVTLDYSTYNSAPPSTSGQNANQNSPSGNFQSDNDYVFDFDIDNFEYTDDYIKAFQNNIIQNMILSDDLVNEFEDYYNPELPQEQIRDEFRAEADSLAAEYSKTANNLCDLIYKLFKNEISYDDYREQLDTIDSGFFEQNDPDIQTRAECQYLIDRMNEQIRACYR